MAQERTYDDRVTIERFIEHLHAVSKDCPGAEIVVPATAGDGDHAPVVVVAFGRIEIS